jgi:sarcosine oxidase
MLPVPHPDDLLRAVGRKHADRMTEMSLGSADELFALIEKHQIRCDARQHGWLRADHCAQARDRSRTAAKAWNQVGANFSFVDGEDVKRLTGSPAYRSATVAPKGGAVQPLSLVRGLARAAQNAGARVFRGAAVTKMKRDGARWALSIGDKHVDADWVVMATNGYTDNAHRQLRRSILPLSPIQMATDALREDQIGPILAEGHTVADTQRQIMYARREPGNRMVYGSVGYQRPFGGIGGFKWLLSDVKRIFPSLADAKWTYQWGGQIAVTTDRLPHVHEPEPNLVAGLGYNGRGVAMANVMGRILAERVLGTAAADLPIPATPIGAMPFRNTQVYGTAIAIPWMRLRDRLEFDKTDS